MRIRTIKPSFYKTPSLCKMPPLTRILFTGLWCLADGHGRLKDDHEWIKIEVLPLDDWDVDRSLDQLAAAGHIARYAVDGVRVIQVVGFREHQRISGKEATAPSKYPGPSDSFSDLTDDDPRSSGGTDHQDGKGEPEDEGSSREATGKHSGSSGEAMGNTGRETETEGRETRARGEPPSSSSWDMARQVADVAVLALGYDPGDRRKLTAAGLRMPGVDTLEDLGPVVGIAVREFDLTPEQIGQVLAWCHRNGTPKYHQRFALSWGWLTKADNLRDMLESYYRLKREREVVA